MARVMEAAAAVIPIAMRTATRVFSRNGLRIWRRKVRGKRARMTSVVILIPVDTLETVRIVVIFTHFPLMKKSHVAASGMHCKASKRKNAADVERIMPIRRRRKMTQVVFCARRRRRLATLIFIQAMEQMATSTETTPISMTCWMSDGVTIFRDEGKRRAHVDTARSWYTLTL